MKLNQKFCMDPISMLDNGEDRAFISELKYEYSKSDEIVDILRCFAEDALKIIQEQRNEIARLKLEAYVTRGL